jgi:hypothetical protein
LAILICVPVMVKAPQVVRDEKSLCRSEEGLSW